MNQNLKTGIIAVVVTLVVSLFGWFLGGSKETALSPAQQMAISQVITDAIRTVGPRAGALAGPEIPSPYLQWGNVNHWAAGFAPVATTTSGVFCSVQVPYGTSTIVHASWRPDVLTGIASTAKFDLSTSTIVSGSSTPALLLAVAINKEQLWARNASSTNDGTGVLGNAANATGNSNVYQVVNTSNFPVYLNWRISTTTGNTGVIPSTLTGNCMAEFVQL